MTVEESESFSEMLAADRQRFFVLGRVVGELVGKTLENEDLLLRLRTIEDNSLVVGRGYLNQRERIEELESQVIFDSLTGLLTREAFENIAREKLTLSRRSGQVHSLLVIDLDDFKRVNDTIGHDKADELFLIPAALAIESSLHRDEDIAGRWGGEEFVVLLENTSQDGALIVAARILEAINQIKPPTGTFELPRLGASIGIASHISGTSYEATFSNADTAMLAAKRGGKNQVQFAEEVTR